ncbi:MAG: hypothetical protein A4E47_00768 [Methanosaeta sp. PtaU1.Bin028]|nr:MAG: hypothetical protein A4E47_00768 [Methanosaeta sp. PtaU1.Bin028]
MSVSKIQFCQNSKHLRKDPEELIVIGMPKIDQSMFWMLLLLVLVQVMAVAMTPGLQATEVRVFEDPSSASNALLYLLLVLGFTAFLLLAMRMGRGWVVSAVIQISVAMSLFYVLSAFLPAVASLVLAGALTLAIRFYPEWYMLDAVGLFISAGVAALFGLSLTVLPALLLLLILAVYDALSVYKTRHMVALAERAIEIKAPLLFVVPRKKGYSFLARESREEKGAYFLGLGDAVIPTVLVVSAMWSLPAPSIFGLALPAAGAMAGTYVGFLALSFTSRDRPQAGLPFLNGGAILGFLIGCTWSGTGLL